MELLEIAASKILSRPPACNQKRTRAGEITFISARLLFPPGFYFRQDFISARILFPPGFYFRQNFISARILFPPGRQDLQTLHFKFPGWTRLRWLIFSHLFSFSCCTSFRSFWQGTCFNGNHLKCDVLGCGFRAWSNVRGNMCYCQWRFNCGLTKQARNYKQWAGADLFSISCYVRPILYMMDAFGADCYSRIRANVALLTLSLLLLV